MKKYIPQALRYEDGGGYFTIHCPTKELAQKLIQAELDEIENDILDEDEQENRIECSLEDIKIQRMYSHRNCDGWSIGEPTCWDCGEAVNNSVGRKTFTFAF